MKKLILSLCVMSLLAGSCNKDDDKPSTITPTVQNLSASYKISKIAFISGSTETPVPNSIFEECRRDDLHKLNLNLTFELVDAGVQCNPSGSKTGSWSLSGNAIVIDGFNGTIRKFDGTNLEVTGSYFGQSAVIYYVKQ
jgi:hypothetical protein